MSKKKKNKTKTKTLVRVATLVMGLGFAGSTLAIALSSVFSNADSQRGNPYSRDRVSQGDSYTASETQQSGDAPSLEEQVQMRVDGYEKVLAREPKNITALEGLAQLHLQTRNSKEAIPLLEKMVEYYPERQEFASILQIVKQQEASPPTQPVKTEEKAEIKQQIRFLKYSYEKEPRNLSCSSRL